MSKTIRTLALVAGSALTLGVTGSGIAVAAGAPTPRGPAATTAVTPVVYPADYPAEPAEPAVAAVAAAPATTSTSETPESAEVEAPENAPEMESATDGTGGHEDPPGTVDHQFEGEE